MNLNLNIENNKNKTYFIHLNKNDIKNIEDIIKLKMINSNISEDSYELKNINKSDLDNIKNIGKYFKSNIDTQCNLCNKNIKKGIIFKELECKHRFHKKCIEPILKNDIYKKCIFCETEHITNNIKNK
jgi:hypothetical protein